MQKSTTLSQYLIYLAVGGLLSVVLFLAHSGVTYAQGTDPFDEPMQQGTDPFDNEPSTPGSFGGTNVTPGGGGTNVTPGGGGTNVTPGGGGTNVTPGVGVTNPLSFGTLQAFFDALLKFLVQIAVPFIVFMLILTGFKFVTAQGKPEELKTAQKMLLYTLIGGMLILGASIIATVIRGTVDSIGLVDPLLQAAAPLLNF